MIFQKRRFLHSQQTARGVAVSSPLYMCQVQLPLRTDKNTEFWNPMEGEPVSLWPTNELLLCLLEILPLIRKNWSSTVVPRWAPKSPGICAAICSAEAKTWPPVVGRPEKWLRIWTQRHTGWNLLWFHRSWWKLECALSRILPEGRWKGIHQDLCSRMCLWWGVAQRKRQPPLDRCCLKFMLLVIDEQLCYLFSKLVELLGLCRIQLGTHVWTPWLDVFHGLWASAEMVCCGCVNDSTVTSMVLGRLLGFSDELPVLVRFWELGAADLGAGSDFCGVSSRPLAAPFSSQRRSFSFKSCTSTFLSPCLGVAYASKACSIFCERRSMNSFACWCLSGTGVSGNCSLNTFSAMESTSHCLARRWCRKRAHITLSATDRVKMTPVYFPWDNGLRAHSWRPIRVIALRGTWWLGSPAMPVLRLHAVACTCRYRGTGWDVPRCCSSGVKEGAWKTWVGRVKERFGLVLASVIFIPVLPVALLVGIPPAGGLVPSVPRWLTRHESIRLFEPF